MHDRGCAWLGGMHGWGCIAGGHAWQWGMLGRGHAWQGVGHVWQEGVCVAGGHAWQKRWPLQQMVHILLECILVYIQNYPDWSQNYVN